MIPLDKATIIEKFKSSAWMDKAQEVLKTPEKVKGLVDELNGYMNKKGLKEVKDKLTTLSGYVLKTLVKSYNSKDKKLIILVAAIIYVVSPFDFIPDFLLGGLMDDSTVIAWIFKMLGDKLDNSGEELEQVAAECSENQTS